MKLYLNPKQGSWEALFQRPAVETAQLEAAVSTVFEQVLKRGDQALTEFTEQYDGVRLSNFEVKTDEWNRYCEQVAPELQEAIRTAGANIDLFHRSQDLAEVEVETTPGVCCWRKSVPIQRVGLYIPGGTAPLFSTVLMLGIPAKIAGCPTRILCTPPDHEGKINPAIAYAAKIAGIQRIYKVGGAQAIAAMSIGTKQIPKVDKLFGPGNQYVTAAKLYAQRLGTAIDMPAGPSEVLVAADDSVPPAFIAADLLAQAEHGIDSQVVFLTDQTETIRAVQLELVRQLTDLPRADMAKEALKNSLMLVLDITQWAAFINGYAPEHLLLMGNYEEQLASEIVNAGSVFLGKYTAESFGDYASGTNHTLPTAGYARNYSGISLDSFVRKMTFQRVTANGLVNLGGTVITMAKAESLQAHATAVEIRLGALDNLELTEQNSRIHERYIRPEFRKLEAYSSARDEFEGVAEIYLDANENALTDGYNRYPDPLQLELKAVISRLKQLDPEQLFIGNGSDEVLDLILRLTGRPNLDNIACLNPSYGMYPVLAKLNGLGVKYINLGTDLEFDLNKVLLQSNLCKILILCNPNNPTGKTISRQQIESILRSFRGVVVVDEAYIDFCPEYSVADLVIHYPNLLVTQTLSKAYGMAGLRIGMAIAHPDWIQALNRIKPPYNISTVAQENAIAKLQNTDWSSIRQTIILEREKLIQALQNCPKVLEVIPSEANFILFRVHDAEETYQYLASKGVVIRNRSKQHNCRNMLRVSIGKPEENQRFIELMNE